jgi:hypothetical protein
LTFRLSPYAKGGDKIVINCVYGSAIGVRSKERINGTRMTRIIADLGFIHLLASPRRIAAPSI